MDLSGDEAPTLRNTQAVGKSTAPFRGPGGSVSRILSAPEGGGRHSSGTHITAGLKQPTRWLDRADPTPLKGHASLFGLAP